LEMDSKRLQVKGCQTMTNKSPVHKASSVATNMLSTMVNTHRLRLRQVCLTDHIYSST